MTWRKVSIGGVELPEYSLLRLTITQTPLEDGGDSLDSEGTTLRRSHWYKNQFQITGHGPEPPLLAGLDLTDSINLIIERYTGDDTWEEVTYTVFARRPPLESDDLRNMHTWSMEFVEVDATVTHALPFTFSLGGVTPHALSQIEFAQTITPVVGGSLVRMGSGAGQIREHWRKVEISISGSGWVPLNGMDALDYTSDLSLSISRLSSIDGDGNPVYSTSVYDVATQGPTHDWDMVARLYRWNIVCQEI